VGADYRWHLNAAEVTLRGEYSWVDEQTFRLFGIREVHPRDGQDAYGITNVYLNAIVRDKYRIRAFVRNATDEEYAHWVLYSAISGFAGNLAPGRTWGVDFSVTLN
jgi:outer membrane receptor protein involved in Fe transport